MADYGMLTEVISQTRSAFLDTDHSIGATTLSVDDAGDFNASSEEDPDGGGGTISLNGTTLAYTDVTWGETEDDSDLILLAVPLAVAADEGDAVTVLAGGLPAEDWYAVVDMGEGDNLPIPLSFVQRAQWPLGIYEPTPVQVSDDHERIEDAPGRRPLGRSAAYNADHFTAVVDDFVVTLNLTYEPQVAGIEVKQNGVDLLPTEFAVDGSTVTIEPSTGVTIRAGDVFSAFYLYDAAGAALTEPTNTDTSAYAAAVLADNPLAYYRLGDETGTVMTDSSGNSHHGAYTDVILAAAGLLTDDPDPAATFPGNNSRGVTAHGSWMNVATFTIEAWVKVAELSSGILAIVNRDTQGRAWVMRIDSGGNLRFTKIQSGTVDSIATATLDDGDRHHVVATYDGSNIKLYVDGSLAQTTAATGNMSTTADLAIGATYAGDSTWWTPYSYEGVVDEVAYYSGALSAARVLAHWQIGSGT